MGDRGDFRIRWYGMRIASVGYPSAEEAIGRAESVRDEIDNSRFTGEVNNNYHIIDGNNKLEVIYDSEKPWE